MQWWRIHGEGIVSKLNQVTVNQSKKLQKWRLILENSFCITFGVGYCAIIIDDYDGMGLFGVIIGVTGVSVCRVLEGNGSMGKGRVMSPFTHECVKGGISGRMLWFEIGGGVWHLRTV